ncbi:MAG: hypothetical protein IT546_07975 [Caulobacteraceae bacterium]|nr:hypothetical protein [Caulobacteraceae bacterium]
MLKSLAKPAGALVATAVLACAGGAFAQTVTAVSAAALGAGYTAQDAPLGAPTELRIDLKGRVAPRCDLVTPPVASGTLRFSRPGQGSAPFAIDCNAPFNLRVVSQHGGFASVDPTPGVKTLMPYEVAVDVGTDRGRRNLGWCRAAALTTSAAGGCVFAPNSPSRGWSSGEDAAINQTGALHLRWAGQAEGAPLLGAYTDTIVIELEVRA